jgi:PAS domain-containing protein
MLPLPWKNAALRRRIAAGLVALFLLLLGCVGVGVYYLEQGARLSARLAAARDEHARLPGPTAALLRSFAAEAEGAGDVGLRNLLLALAGVLAIGVPLALLVWRAATQPLRRVSDVLRRAQRGELGGADAAVRDEVGELVAPLVAMLEAHRSSEALHREKIAVLRDRIHVLLGSLPLGVVITDAEGAVVEVNAVARAMSGGSIAEGGTVATAKPEALRDVLVAGLRGEIESAPTALSFTRGDREVHVRCLTRRVRNPAGDLRGCVAILEPVGEVRPPGPVRDGT